MAGQPKTRAKRAAAAAKNPAGASESGGSRARGGAQAKSKPAKKRRPPARFEVASPDDFAAVEKAMAKAAAKTDEGKTLTAADRVERDAGIVAAWALGLSPGTIAEQSHLHPDHVKRIVDAHRERRAKVPLPASHELLHDALEALEAQMERMTLLASKSGAPEASVVGAVRTWKEMWTSRLELMQAMNLISRSPASDARLARARDMLRGLLDVLRDMGVEQSIIDAAASRVLVGDDPENVVAIEARAR